MTWPSHDLTPQQTSRHQNTSLQSTKHHHHGTAEGSFTAKKWFGHRAGRSPCTFYRQILSVLYSSFPFGNFRPRLVRALLVYIYIYIYVLEHNAIPPVVSASWRFLRRLPSSRCWQYYKTPPWFERSMGVSHAVPHGGFVMVEAKRWLLSMEWNLVPLIGGFGSK